jgi:hypothetical protein
LIYAFEKWMPGPPGSQKSTQGNIALIALLVSAGGLAAITAQVIGLRGSLEKIQKDKKLMAAEQANMSKLRTVKQLFNFPGTGTNLPAVYPDPYFRTAATKADGTLRSTTGGSASWALWGGSTSPAGSPNFYGKKLAISSISPEKSDLARVFAGTTAPVTVMGPVTSAQPVSPDVTISQLNSNAVSIGGKVYYRPATLDLAVNTSYQKGSLEEASTRQGLLRQLALKARLTLQAPPLPTCRITVDKSVIDTGQSVRATMTVNGIAVRGQMSVPRRAAAATFGPAVHAQANSIYARDVVFLESDMILTTTSYPSENQQVTGNVLAADLATTVACASSAAVTVKGPPPPGQLAQKVGVNFEDHPFSGDKDFNDAVLCFTGAVYVNGGSVVSAKDQVIEGVVTKISSCDADITISIEGPGDYRWTSGSFKSQTQPVFQMPFKAGSKLEVKYNPDAACGDNARTEVAMGNTDWAKVTAENCNQTGK